MKTYLESNPLTSAIPSYLPDSAAMRERLGVENTKISRSREELAGMSEMRNKNAEFNRLFNFAMTKYINAGYDVENAQQYARSWANQINDQNFQAEMAQKERDNTTERMNMSKEYGGLMSGQVQQKDPYQEALQRSIFGLTEELPYIVAHNYKGSNGGWKNPSDKKNTGFESILTEPQVSDWRT